MSEEWRPRFFWRRVFALLIDYLLAYFVTLLVLIPFLNPDENGLRLGSGLVRYYDCESVATVPQELIEFVAPAEIVSGKLCENWSNFVYNGRTLEVRFNVEVLESGLTRSNTLTVWLDGDDRLLTFTFEPHDTIVLFSMIFASAVLLARGRRTPGKALVSLQIQGDGDAMIREVWRLGPLLLLPAAIWALEFFGLFALAVSYIGEFTAYALLLGVPLFAYYILPLLYWNGAMPWDKAAGYTVVRA